MLKGLTHLDLTLVNVNRMSLNESLQELAGLTNLQSLVLDSALGTYDSLESLKALSVLKHLTNLNLAGNLSVTNKGLKHLAGFKSLTTLDLSKTEVADEGLQELATFTRLTRLRLAGAEDLYNRRFITDAGMKRLARLESLVTLDLSNTRVTDAGLKELSGLKNLRSLLLYNTKVTKAGATMLRRALPKCDVRISYADNK